MSLPNCTNPLDKSTCKLFCNCKWCLHIDPRRRTALVEHTSAAWACRNLQERKQCHQGKAQAIDRYGITHHHLSMFPRSRWVCHTSRRHMALLAGRAHSQFVWHWIWMGPCNFLVHLANDIDNISVERLESERIQIILAALLMTVSDVNWSMSHWKSFTFCLLSIGHISKRQIYSKANQNSMVNINPIKFLVLVMYGWPSISHTPFHNKTKDLNAQNSFAKQFLFRNCSNLKVTWNGKHSPSISWNSTINITALSNTTERNIFQQII